MPVFIPLDFGYKRLNSVPANASYNTVREHLGYNAEQTYTWFGDFDPDFDIQTVALELFTRNVVFIGVKEGVVSIDPRKLKHFLRNLDDSELYDSYNVNSTLTEGIANKSLSSNFLGRVLNIKDIVSDGVFFSEKLDLYLFFSQGVLNDFQASDGLNKWAKHWKQINPRIVEAYENAAKKHWGNNMKQVLREVNVQADALAGVPQAVRNEFVGLHTDEDGLVNFHMLLVCHYDHDITLEDFLTINHGRYIKLSHSTDELYFFRLGKFDYIFGADGDLIQAVLR